MSQNRVIKFRVWYKNGKRFYYSDSGDLLLSLSGKILTNYGSLGDNKYETYPSENEDDCILQQFTGLLDKNGREIYEGDIVKNVNVISKLFGQLSPVKWIPLITGFNPFNLMLFEKDGMFEIVGNIFENPELLK